jgi:hypothetical protein
LGECVLFTWPSDGQTTSYLPDRRDARASAADLAELLDGFYVWLLDRQEAATRDPKLACRAKVSVIAHSMGNYVLQKAAQMAWSRRNQPLLVSLINQLVMVAADVDNDLFASGETTDGSDGDALANLTYRITALYSGLDQVLGVSAGLKHFGKRRLGRSGIPNGTPRPDNVWDVDCTPFFEQGPKTKSGIHSAYFEHPGHPGADEARAGGDGPRGALRAGSAHPRKVCTTDIVTGRQPCSAARNRARLRAARIASTSSRSDESRISKLDGTTCPFSFTSYLTVA